MKLGLENRERSVEVFGLIALQLFQMVWFSSLLLGKTTLSHDNQIWNFPTFQWYFSDLANGHIPIFNFFTRFGEPFVPMASQMRFWDPIQSFIGVVLWKLSPSAEIAFNWFHYLLGLIQCWGIFIFLRKYATRAWIRVLVFAVLLMGSAFITPFRQDGILNQFLWIPFIAMIVRDRFIYGKPTWRSCLLLGTLIGSAFQSYFFVMTGIFVFSYLAFSWINRVDLSSVWSLFRKPHLLALLILPLVLMSGINLMTLMETKNLKFPIRLMPTSIPEFYKFDARRVIEADQRGEGLEMSQDRIRITGAGTRFWDYIQMFSPWGNKQLSSNKELHYGDPSEAYFYIGLLPLVLGFLGLGLVKSKEDWVWLNIFTFFYLMSFGQDALLMRSLAKVIPFLSFVRNAHCLTLFVHLSFMYFVVRGCNYIDEKLARAA
ncbi:MAG: hypothetical protein AB7F86_10665 [Bdellovibrionales bacterium]